MQARGWTVTRLARVSHVSQSCIQEYVHARKTPDPACLARIAVAMNVPVRSIAFIVKVQRYFPSELTERGTVK